MESRDPSPSSSYSELPPEETEEHLALESESMPSALSGGTDVSDAPSAEDSAWQEAALPVQDAGNVDAGAHADLPPPAKEVPHASASDSATDPSKQSAARASSAPASDVHPVPPRDALDKAAQFGLGSRQATAAPTTPLRRANLRRSTHPAKLMALTLLAYLLVLVGAGWWFHRRLMSDIEEMNRLQSARIEELAAALSATKTALEERMKVAPAPSPAVPAPSPVAPAPSPVAPAALPLGDNLSATQSELLLLKERNRLTSFADEAIATGARAPYERLWQALDDPRLANLVHAARAEILRVQNFYLGGSRIDRYDIPVEIYFPEEGTLRDSQLKDDQLIELLREKKNPWEVRLKAANLLGTRRSIEAADALVAAVKHDENLDVVKEATFSFEHMTGFRARIFDAAALAQWWQKYKAIPTPPKSKSNPATPKPAEPPAKDGPASS